MGLFARLSPEGRYIAGTVSETSVFVQMSDVYFSQLFFPATGQLAVFDTQTKKIDLLPGAAREDMVQTGPGWSPDGRSIAFSAAPVEPALIGKVLDKTVYNESSNQNIFQLNKKYPVKFDIYTLPFNQGKGGTARPLEGASNNGFSNYFPRYSPDGKWIVYTRSPTGLVLQPYSKLYIVPATGGRARELESNQPVMNSWHSWSPNSKWLVFTSKANSPFTELYLTHINNKGNASPAIRLFRFSSNDLAAMVPEFIPESATIPRAITYGPGTKGKSMATDGR
jgi:Tol biopolymer transport system component